MITIYGISIRMLEGRLHNTAVCEREVDETEHPWSRFNDEIDMILVPTTDSSFEFYSIEKRLVETYQSALHLAGSLYELGHEETLRKALDDFREMQNNNLLL